MPSDFAFTPKAARFVSILDEDGIALLSIDMQTHEVMADTIEHASEAGRAFITGIRRELGHAPDLSTTADNASGCEGHPPEGTSADPERPSVSKARMDGNGDGDNT